MRYSLLVWLVLLAACQTNEADEFAGEEGVRVTVEVLDSGFVLFEGKRIAVEFFLLEMRRRVRANWGDREKLPSVYATVAEGTGNDDSRWTTMLLDELQKAGVPRLTFGSP